MSGRAFIFALAAGGTGGHLFPARALGAELKKRGHDVTILTDGRGLAFAEMLSGMAIEVLPSGTFAKKGMVEKIKTAARIAAGAFRAYRLFRRTRPAAVIGFGGYPSLPAMLGARLARVPTCVHEQNAVLGRVNGALAPYVDAVALTFEHTHGLSERDRAKAVVTGNPVRAEIAAIRERPYPAIDEKSALNLLVFGGSQGAKVLSDAVPAAIAALPPVLRARIEIVQQCRPEDIDAVRKKYEDIGAHASLTAFIADMARELAKAHLVIGRSGASTVCELAVAGRPGILVPLPNALRDEQTMNARHLAEAGGGWLIPEPQFSPIELAKRLQKLLTNPGALQEAAKEARAMGHPGAAAALADLVEAIAARVLPRTLTSSSTKQKGPALRGRPFNRRMA